MPRTPENPRPRRVRPMMGFTLSPEVETAIRERAKSTGEKISRIADEALRIGLDIAPPPGASA